VSGKLTKTSTNLHCRNRQVFNLQDSQDIVDTSYTPTWNLGKMLQIIIIIILLLLLLLLLFAAIGLLHGGSGYFTCIQNMKLVTTKFKDWTL